MPVGLQVWNSSGFMQIDGEYCNLALWSKGTITTTTKTLEASYASFNLSGLPGFPVIAVRSASGAMAYVTNYSGGSCTVRVGAKGDIGTSVTYYVFCPPDPSAPSGGLEVRNASGQVVFNAAQKYMRVVGTLIGNASTSGGDSESITMPAGKTYAVMCNRRIARNRVINQSPAPPYIDYWTYNFFGYFKVVSNVVTVTSANFQAVSFGSSSPPEVNLPGTGFILDVTNY